jgi:hypothetical protein
MHNNGKRRRGGAWGGSWGSSWTGFGPSWGRYYNAGDMPPVATLETLPSDVQTAVATGAEVGKPAPAEVAASSN